MCDYKACTEYQTNFNRQFFFFSGYFFRHTPWNSRLTRNQDVSSSRFHLMIHIVCTAVPRRLSENSDVTISIPIAASFRILEPELSKPDVRLC